MTRNTGYKVRLEQASQLSIIITAIWWFVEQNFTALLVALVAIVLCIGAMRKAPSLISLWLNSSLAIHIVIGMALGGYEWRYFDDVLHLSFVGTLTLIILNDVRQKITWRRQALSSLQLIFAGTMFSLAIGSSWEMFEYLVDLTHFYKTQRGLTDTMTDIFGGSLGGILASLVASRIELSPASFAPIPLSNETNESLPTFLKGTTR